MFCTKCGHELPENAKFCPKCGASRLGPVEVNESGNQTEKDTNLIQSQSPDFSHLEDKDTQSPFVEDVEVSHTAQQSTTNAWTEYEKVVQKNVTYYIPQFQKIAAGEKTKFNWAAFFFTMYFCFYRKCAHMFKKYFLVPLIVTLISTGILTIGFSNFSLTLMAVGGVATLIGYIWYFVSAIRFGKNFTREYYAYVKTLLTSGTEKQYGTSLAAALVCIAVYSLLNILIGTIGSLLMFSSFTDLDTPDINEPSASITDNSTVSSSTDTSSTSAEIQDVSPDITFTSGTFATTSNASSAYNNGGIVVELEVVGEQVTYTVTSISASQRIASISGVSDLGDTIHASGDDGWGNIVEGDIIAMDDDFISVEFEVVTLDEYAMWDLSCPYTILTRCTEEETTTTSSYPIQIRMDNLMSANILGDTFWSAYEGGWIEEWMSLYVNESSDPNILYEPFWYDEQLGEWTYYGITYSQAEEAGWGTVWTEILANNGYTRY